MFKHSDHKEEDKDVLTVDEVPVALLAASR